MILVRAPVRVSFAGGGTDLEAYYKRYTGMVVSTTIDKYFYVFLNQNSPSSVQVSSSDYRTYFRHSRGEPPLWDGDLGLVRAALHEFGIEGGVSLFLASEVPPGTGLGSSSAVAVALVKALSTFMDQPLSSPEVAEAACLLEIDRLGAPIGKQDQYASAFGGLNAMTFDHEGTRVEPVRISAETRERLERNILLFLTGFSRPPAAILAEQKRATERQEPEAIEALHAIKEAAIEVRRCLETGDLRTLGEVLDVSWQHKKRLARRISNPRIDEMYEVARRHGALGGKITGAGGGGFLMLYCEEPYQQAVVAALEKEGLYRMDYRFERGGAMVLVNAMGRPLSLTGRA